MRVELTGADGSVWQLEGVDRDPGTALGIVLGSGD